MDVRAKESSRWSEVRSLGAAQTAGLIWNREMQVFLVGYMVVSLAEIFTVGGFLTNRTVLVVCYRTAV